MKINFLILLLVSFCVIPGTVFSSEKMIKVKSNGDIVSIETNYFNVVIDSNNGGKISSFIPKDTGKEIIFDASKAGLFIDHFSEQGWPGEFWGKKYTCRIEEEPEKLKVVLSTVSTGSGASGYMSSTPVNKLLSGITLEKTFTFFASEKYVRCKVRFKNNDKDGKSFSYWVQHVFVMEGSQKDDLYIRPSEHCQDIIGGVGESNQENIRWVKDTIAGWTGTVDAKSKNGLLFLMDYNYLTFLYNCPPSCTTEWRYSKVMLPVNAEWETEIYMIYAQGLSGYSFASKDIILDIDLKQKEGGNIDINYQGIASINKADSVKLQASVFCVSTDQAVSLKPLEMKLDGQKVSNTAVSCEKPLEGDPKIVKTEVEVSGNKDWFDYFYAGNYGYNSNIKMDMVNPVYKSPQKEKKEVFLKPAHITKGKNEKIKVLFFKGLFSGLYGIDDKMLQKLGGGSLVVSYHTFLETEPCLSYFPVDYSELMSYDVIVLGNIDFNTLKSVGAEMIRDFVENGGSLIILGGDRSYGQSGFTRTQLEELFPVEIEKRGDIKKLDSLKLRGGKKIQAADNLYVYYLHKQKIKDGAEVLLEAGTFPFVVAKNIKKGKVVAILGTVYGTAQGDNTPFWLSSKWEDIMAEIMKQCWMQNDGGIRNETK